MYDIGLLVCHLSLQDRVDLKNCMCCKDRYEILSIATHGIILSVVTMSYHLQLLQARLVALLRLLLTCISY